MLPHARARLPRLISRPLWGLTSSRRPSSTDTTTNNPVPTNNPNRKTENPPTAGHTSAVTTSSQGAWDKTLQESPEEAEEMRVMQAPNRRTTWSRSQNPREKAMVGPRFEQMIMKDQPRPLSAMELIHKQPVRWTKEREVACDGGGGPLGHPRIFINLDKPQICWCTYCGVPFANEHHRAVLEAQPSTSYPLEPSGDAAEVGEAQRVSNETYGHR